MRPNHLLTKLMLVVTVLVMTGVPAMAQAAAGQQQQNSTVDPSASPKMPSASTEQAPETTEPAAQESLPSAPTPSVQPAPQAQQQTQQQTQTPQQPDGTAAAQRAHTEGGPASKPAGMAIAPAKQKQTRSLLIKVGAVLAAGAAIGTVYALTRATPSTPPNTGAATTTAAAK